MAMVIVDASCLKQADSQPKSCGLVWGSAAAWRSSTFTRWTEWTLAMTWSWWQHYKYRRGYYYYYYYYFRDKQWFRLKIAKFSHFRASNEGVRAQLPWDRDRAWACWNTSLSRIVTMPNLVTLGETTWNFVWRWAQKTRMMPLPGIQKDIMICSFFKTQDQHSTDRQADTSGKTIAHSDAW